MKKRKKWTDTDQATTMELYDVIKEVVEGKPAPEAALALGMNLIECFEPQATCDTAKLMLQVLWEHRPEKPC